MTKRLLGLNYPEMMMKCIRLFLAMSLSALALTTGCTSLPNATEVLDEASNTEQPLRIASGDGLLSAAKSKAIIDRLKRTANPTDLLERHNAALELVSETPLTKGNKVSLLSDGPATYEAMSRLIEGAKDHINLETFIIDADEVGHRFSDLLLKKQAEGVQVNLIYDAFGSIGDPASFFKRLRDAGIHVLEINPINPFKVEGTWRLAHPDHRKLLVVDGTVAITGGINISSVYSSKPSDRDERGNDQPAWRDTDIQIEGPAVAECQKLFIDTWDRDGGEKLPDRNYFPVLRDKGDYLVRVVGNTPGQSNRITFIAYVAAFTFAERSIHLTNAYFVPDEQILDALSNAAARGVDVKIIIPATSDSSMALHAARYNYSALLKAGVKLYERRKVLLHAKTAVIDGVWSTVGSTNLDSWSLQNDDEINAIVLSREFADEMEALFAADLKESDEIKRAEWKARPFLDRMKERFAHFFVRWL
jgi:cardiolipin synthase